MAKHQINISIKYATVVLLLHVFSCSCESLAIPGRYVKREEIGSSSRLRFTSGSYGYYNASTVESHTLSVINSDMKMGIYVYDAHTKIDYEVDKTRKFSVKSEQIEDFVFLRLKVEGVLNSDVQSTHTINVIAKNRRTKEMIDRTTIYLHVLDINEFTPTFQNRSRIQTTVSENLKIGSTVFQVKATDADIGKNGEVFYFIPPNEVFSVQDFSLHPHTGELILVRPLNFDKKNVYNFHIVARDKCPNEKLRRSSAPLPVKITVKNVMNFPVAGKIRGKRQGIYDGKAASIEFSKKLYEHSIPEISPPFTPVVRVGIVSYAKTALPNVVFGFHRGNEEGCFQINSKTGQIYTVKELDYEKDKMYNLIVIAYHKGLIKGRSKVVINVLDSNDHSPRFPRLLAEITIPEEKKVGATIYEANATDLDTGINSKIVYSIGNINSTYFDIETYSGRVKIAKRLDRDGIQQVPSVLYLLIKAMDLGFPIRREGRMILKIKIKKINDNPPVLPHSQCSVSIAENVLAGSPVMEVDVVDLDRSSSSGFEFSMTGNILSIDKSSGEISVKDLATQNKKFAVSVSDGKYLTSFNLTVAVLPKRNSKKINISCSNSPDYARAKSIISKRKAAEKSLFVETFKPITMSPSKVHKPIFLEKPDTTIFLKEDLPIGSYVTRVLAVDKELKCYGLVVYSIVSGNNNADSNFEIDMLNGTVFLSGKIDREQKAFYTLRIRAGDTDSPPHYTDIDVRIEILDVNDNGPRFRESNFNVKVREDMAPGSTIMILAATDPDEGPNGDIRYAMVSDLHDIFSLEKYTGILKLEKKLDYESQKEYTIHIQALDSSNEDIKISQATIHVEIIDVNDTPPTCLPKIQSKEISRDFPAGVVIGKINAFDPDSGQGGKVVFEIEKGKPQRLFTIDREYGILRTNLNTVSSFKEHFLNISVKVTDLGIPALSTNCYFICILKPIVSFERPKFQTSENPVIRNLQDGSNILGLTADLEGSTELEYSLVDGNGLDQFSVDSKTGYISRVRSPEKETTSRFWLTLNAHLKENPAIYSNIPILIKARKTVDKLPYFDPSVYRVSVKENLEPKTEVVQLFAVDPNIGSNLNELVFNIVSGNGEGRFQVTKSGVILTSVKLDREIQDNYHLNISVFNTNRPKVLSFASVSILVDDMNDNGPVISNEFPDIKVLEQDPTATDNATFVYQVRAYDKDIGINAALRFSISDGGEKFNLNPKTGVVTSRSRLIAGESYFVTCNVQDSGTPSHSASLVLAILVEPKPVMTSQKLAFKKKLYTIKIREFSSMAKAADARRERLVAGIDVMVLQTMLMTQMQPGYFLAFSIESGNEDGKFAISSITDLDQLRLIAELDHEEKQTYFLKIKVTDGNQSDRTTIQVIVEDVNDNPPMTSQSCYQTEMAENGNQGRLLTQIEALDPDSVSKGKLSYKLLSVSPPAQNWFSVDSLSGKIRTSRSSFDRETVKRYILTLVATDHASIPALKTAYCVAVDIKDANDHRPRFTESLYKTHVDSSLSVGAPLIRLLAVDDDTGTNALTKFVITSGNEYGYFAMHSATGIISLAQKIGLSKRKVFRLSVEVSDSGMERQFKDKSTVEITVMPQKPITGSTNSTYTVIVPENQSARPILEVPIANFRAHYEIMTSESSCAVNFHIDYLSGVISTKDPMDAEKNKSCTLPVLARDGNSFSKRISVIVVIKDLNDNPPVFVNKTYSGSIDEGSGRGSEILDDQNRPLVIKAIDKDSGENARISYSVLETSAKRYFDVDSNTGKLVTRQVLDREKIEHFKFHVQALDNGSPKLFAFTEVSVKVKDINDKMPEFTKQIYRVKLYTPVYNHTEVTTVRANDGDTNVFGSVSYQLLNHKDKFGISPRTGKIWTKNAANLNAKSYALQIAASDGIFTSTCQVQVNLLPLTGSPLKFSKDVFHASVPENDKHSKTLIILNVVGYEIGECILFSIVNPTDGFNIDSNTGVIKTQSGSNFDREQRAYFILIVQARLKRDQSQVAQAMVNVSVEDANDNRPVFTNEPYYQSVHIDAVAGSLLIQVHANDADTGSNAVVRYEISSGSFGKFSIDDKTGIITLKERFVKGKTPAKFILEINAHDMGNPQLATATKVEVPVVNEEMPVFDKNYNLVVSENAAPGTKVGQIVAKGPHGRDVYYSIPQGDEFNQFSLDFNTGELTVIDKLDRISQPSYNITLQATDSRSGSWSTTGCTITVSDVNNHRPMFGQPMYVASVSESASKHTLVAVIQAADLDVGLNADIRYSLSSVDGKRVPFMISPTSGAVSVFGDLDYESQSAYYLRVKAVDRGQPPLSSSTFLKINLLNVNDNPPFFDQSKYNFIVGDYVKPGQFIGKVQCVDPEYRNGSKIRYVISDSTLVTVDAWTGIVRLNRKPPREAQFAIHCTDEKSSVSVDATLTSEISNEHNPELKTMEQTIGVQENDSPSFITVVTAIDYDQGTFGSVTYSIDSSSLQEKFHVNPTTGDIFSKVSLDREKEKDGRIILPIRASDGGGRFVFCKITINILDANDNEPIFEFSSYEATVSSATQVGSTILTVKAVDYDSGKNGEISYSLSGLDESVPLQINKETGVLQLTGTPRGKAYQFVVKALDNGYPVRESSAQVRVNVIPSNQQSLKFKSPFYSVVKSESAVSGQRIAMVAVNNGADVKYRFIQGNLPSTNATGVFSINENTGSIHLSGALDFETVPNYSLLVSAYEAKNPESKAFMLVKIKVENSNDNPPVFESKEYNITIPENIAVNTKVMQATATDADDGSVPHLKYRFTKSTSEEIKRLFSVDHNTGEIKTIGRLNTEKRSTYEMQVKVLDGKRSGSIQNPNQKSFFDTTNIRITVLDTNDSPPVFVQGRRVFTIREDHVVGEKVAAVLAQDADKNPTIRYYIMSGNEFGHFRIDHVTGEISLVSALDRETSPRHTLEVVAYDGVFTAVVNVHIVVSDTNDNSPICSKAFYVVKVPEGTGTGLPVTRIQATDPDSDDRLTYSLQGDGVSKFTVNKNTGDLTPRAGIDREKHSTCEFKALVTDTGGHMCFSDVYVEVMDKNDNKPIFTQAHYIIPVRENASVSAMLARVQALDADKGRNRQVTYQLASVGSGIFSVHPKTGIIVLEKALDKNKRRNHTLIVEAVDGGDPALSSSAKVSIVVLGKSDKPPEFTKTSYVYTVSENSEVGHLVGNVATAQKSKKSSEVVEFELVTGSRATFDLDKSSGAIKLLKKLDYEKTKTVTLSVKAKYTHLPSLSSVVLVTVNVLDENDNAPVFLRKTYATSVDENIRAGAFVLQVFADDKDERDNGRVSYRLVSSGREIPFKIDKLTGVISIAGTRPVDREEKDSYVFSVRAYDLGSPPLFTDVTVNVTVADLNDNAPVVDHPNATKIIQEGIRAGTVVFSWTATDRDTGKNAAPFTYTLISGDKSFSILEESDVKGSLITTGDMKTSGKSRYEIVVRVTDNGSPPQSSLCRLTLHVVKESKERPVIVEPTVFFLVVKKPAESVTVGRIRVTDKDKDDLHQFKIKSGNDDNTFSIGTLNGIIKGRPRQGIYTINVEVSDGKYFASAVITIIVNTVSEDLYRNSVVLTALDISADEFVRDKMRDFANHIRFITSAKIENIAIWAVQTRHQRRKARDLESTSDTDVAFAVKRTDENGFIKPTVLETSLKDSKERLERKLRLSFIVSVTDQCSAAPCPVDKKCISVVRPSTGINAGASSDKLAVKFTRGYACLCLDGSRGPDCTGITACSSNPCKNDEKCIPYGSSYKCQQDIDADAIQLDGKDYVGYVLRESFDSIFKSIAVSFRTEANEGYLFYAKGHDYCFLQIYEGKVRFKFDFGTGPGIIRIDDIQVNDGRWHDVEVIRNVNHATLSLDGGKFKAHGRSKGEHVKINLDGNKVYFGAGVITPGKVENGFKGCMRHAKLNGKILPWSGNNSLVSSARSFGVKKSCKDSGACLKTSCPLFSDCINTLSSYRCQCMPGHTGILCKPQVTCKDNPCRNNGICTYFESNGVIEYRCKCSGPYSGAQCQTISGLCASNPCRNGGQCISIEDNTGYRCKCPARYSGQHCELDNDPCASMPCYHNAKCVKTRYDFKCECPAGTKGKRCGFGEYCMLYSCGRGGKCEERLDGPVCKCNKGYSGNNCQNDVNECLAKQNPCQGLGTCVNNIGGYFCNCSDGRRAKDCHIKAPKAAEHTGVSMMTIVYIAGSAFVALFIVILIFCCRRKCRGHVEYMQPDSQGGPDVKYPYACYELDQFPPTVPPHDGPPEYYPDNYEEFPTAALYDPSQIAVTPPSSEEDSCIKQPLSDSETPSKSRLHTFRVDSGQSSPRGSAADMNGKGSASDVSDAGDRLNGPYHWDYSEVPEDVVNRSKPTRTRSKEGSRMGLTYNLGYEETPKLSEMRCRRGSMQSNKEDEVPEVPTRPTNYRLSRVSLTSTENASPPGGRRMKKLDVPTVNTERSPTIKRAAGASRGSDGSLLEPYQSLNTHLTAHDFNNRYSLTMEGDTSSLYLQDLLGGDYPAPPSETCPSDIDTCTRPSLSVVYSEADDIPYHLRQRRMLPSEISGLDGDGMSETSYNSDDDNDNYCEKDPLDPDETRKLERDIKILIKDIKTRTEADV